MKKNIIKTWMDNARSGSLVQSVMPAVLAVVLAIGMPGFNIFLAILAVVGVACAHLAMNLADDYFDYKVDMAGDRDAVIRKGFRAMTAKYEYLQDGSATIKDTFWAIVSFSAAALVCGIVIMVFRGWQTVLLLTAVTGFLGVFYSAPPLKLAYRGLGEVEIGVIFGPLLMMGVYYSTCGVIDSSIINLSIPVGLLVLNILFTHSFIERVGDAESNKMTFARLLGGDKANLIASAIINFVPFLMVIYGVCTGIVSWPYLLVLAILPRAIWLLGSLRDFTLGKIDVPADPPKFLGKMDNWEAVKEKKVDWFLLRWFTARNLLSGFCTTLIIAKIITLIIGC